MAQASVQLLGDDYGKGSAEHHHPPRGQWRNTHRQQQAGEQGGIIFQRGSNRLFTQFENSGFGRPGRQGGEDNLQYGAPAEKPGLDHNARHSGEQHQQHNTRGLPLVMGIGGACDSENHLFLVNCLLCCFTRLNAGDSRGDGRFARVVIGCG